jgi:hypothetical protein
MGPRITILELGSQETLISRLVSHVGLSLHFTNHVIETTMAMTLDPYVSPNTNIDIVEPQAIH